MAMHLESSVNLMHVLRPNTYLGSCDGCEGSLHYARTGDNMHGSFSEMPLKIIT